MLRLNKTTFEENLNAGGVLVVDFWAVWCGPCRMLAPIFEQVAESLGGEATLGKLNIDDNMPVAQKYSVMSIPTIIVFKGGKEVERIVGLRQKNQLIDIINKYV